MTASSNQYIRQVLHHSEPPPTVQARFFYTSPLAIDDPLSPLPPPATAVSATSKQPPRPFSEYDNSALEQAWLDLRKKLLQYSEEGGEKPSSTETLVSGEQRVSSQDGKGKQVSMGHKVALETYARLGQADDQNDGRHDSVGAGQDMHLQDDKNINEPPGTQSDIPLPSNLTALDGSVLPPETDVTNTTGTPFIRAPSRRKVATTNTLEHGNKATRPQPLTRDTYQWGSAEGLQGVDTHPIQRKSVPVEGPSCKVAVGISRLHNVVMPDLNMKPIYWAPVHDVATVVRATWFYKDTLLPVETPVANMLELGYIELQPWAETWQDELNSAIEVGAAGEEKILRRLWPEQVKARPSTSRPGTARGEMTGIVASSMAEPEPDSAERLRERDVEAACDIIDITSGADNDNRAAGTVTYGRYGPTRMYAQSGVIYENATAAHILKPNLQPSTYYGRRPLASYIRKNRKIGVPVIRGFKQESWDKLYPPKKGPKMTKAQDGVSTSQSGVDPRARQNLDPDLAHSMRPTVTDLVLVIHGIGQKLSERMESFHFTHAINTFRRDVNVELGTDSVKSQLRKDAGGIMVLPVNWRHGLSFDEGGYRDENEETAPNQFSLRDITPESLPSVRNIVSDVMLDVPYYLSHHQPKMIAAVIGEANRIYKLWCANNPGFSEKGRVHILSHSLGSVMAVDILSEQPTAIAPKLQDPAKVDLESANLPHFLFNTTNLFMAGSPAGFFLLLKRAQLLPRLRRSKPDKDPSADTRLVCGERGTYGCIAVDNIYNVINPYDPVSYRINATVDAKYASTLKATWIPSAVSTWFSSSNGWFGSSQGANVPSKLPALPRLPSNVELETHDFSQEEIAEKRMYLLNDNGQIDFFVRYGGGPLEIQYLTMLSAHSSYWLLKDFVRMIVLECGRKPGRDGALLGMRAVKKKPQLS